jgi:hypothetical protein
MPTSRRTVPVIVWQLSWVAWIIGASLPAMLFICLARYDTGAYSFTALDIVLGGIAALLIGVRLALIPKIASPWPFFAAIAGCVFLLNFTSLLAVFLTRHPLAHGVAIAAALSCFLPSTFKFVRV